ncbi:MAG: nucleotidyltransferase [Lachnospiraceae bacterium]|nr:nucleotidyltransferase [Lachnospiraceae bacterium]
MENTTLVIMAAGIGSRFGKGIKQLTPVGPSGELIMDYTVHDALEAGFNKVVFILRKDILDEFHRTIGRNIESRANVEYVFQELNDLPEGFSCPADRVKPWGTGQAVLCCKGVVKEPFCVVNADDYYGKEPYKLIHDYLVDGHAKKEGIADICAAGFRLGNTLSENGGVTRGICTIDEEGRLTGIDETKNIVKTKDGAVIRTENGDIPVDPDRKASMNMWGFEAGFIDMLEEGFRDFLSGIEEGDIKSEYLLPIYIDQLIREKRAEVKVLPTNETWFGVTFQEDKEAVIKAFAKLVENGVYKENLYA